MIFSAKKILTLGALLLALAFPASAWAITVDGQTSDWGITPAAFGSSDWTPNPGVYYIQEDQNPSIDFLSPGWGGQKFDAEGIYFTRDTTYAYIAVISGFPLEGRIYGGAPYYAGDLGFDFGSDGSYEFGVETTGANKGKLFGNATWTNPLFISCGPYALAGGNILGNALFAYDKTTYIGTGHYVFEVGIPLSLFGSAWSNNDFVPDLTIHWTMSCGNDCIDLKVTRVPNVPEPSTVILLVAGLLVFAARSFLTKNSAPALS